MIWRKFPSSCYRLILKYSQNPLLQGLKDYWQNRSFQFKLSILLILSAALPTILATQGIIIVARNELEESETKSLHKGLADFQYHIQQVKNDYQVNAQALQQRLEQAEIDTTNPDALVQNKELLENIINNPIDSKYQPSFYLFTDNKGRTIAHNIRAISNFNEDLVNLKNKPVTTIYRYITVPISINTADIKIVNHALTQQRSLSGIEILPRQFLEKIGLDIQANIGYRRQPIDNLPISQQPFPIGTYDTDNARIGLSILAAQPITVNSRVVGTVVVGTLLNRNYQLVDQITKVSGVTTATLFAYDWRVSTNVPNDDAKTRAIGTRVARKVAESVLERKQTFMGQVNIVGKSYRAAYAPIYSHYHQINSTQVKPIGIYYVGNPETKVQQTLKSLALTGYSIGGGFILLAIIIAIPGANAFSRSIRELTKFAQSIGRGELHVRLQISKRRDEIGILEKELNYMAQQISINIQTRAANELKIRASAQELQNALKELKVAQTQLVQNAKMSGLENLVAGIAHEINNPVSFIYGNISCTKEYIQNLIYLIKLYQSNYPNPPEQINGALKEVDFDFMQQDIPKILNSMTNGAQRICRIVESLRAFSRMDEAEYKLVNLHNNIDCILDLINYKLQPKSSFPAIKIIKEYEHIPEIECYAGQLNQVFMNLFNNAIDAIEEAFAKNIMTTNPEIHIKTKVVQHDTQNYIQIIIADNGIGIADDIQQSIFDPFFTTKPVGKGTEMGLAISYQIVTEKHHGTLKCISTPEKGAKFIIQIPVYTENG